MVNFAMGLEEEYFIRRVFIAATVYAEYIRIAIFAALGLGDEYFFFIVF